MWHLGTSPEGLDAEWPMILLLSVEDDLINRCEIFDVEDLDAALARFDELDRPIPPLENASTRTWVRLVDAYNRRDMSGFLALMTEDARLDDRRKGLRGIHDGLALWKNVQQLFQARSNWQLSMEPIAIRGSHLSLTRHRVRDIDETDQPITWEALSVMEVGEDNLMRDHQLRPRGHRRRLRGTRRPVSRRGSGCPLAHVGSYRASLCRTQSRRPPCDDVGLREHRPPPRDSVCGAT